MKTISTQINFLMNFKSIFTILNLLLLSLLFYSCGTDDSNQSDNLTGIAPDNFQALNTTLTIVDNEQSRIITLNPTNNVLGSDGLGNYNMSLLQFEGSNATLQLVYYRGSYTYSKTGTNTGILDMKVTSQPDLNSTSTSNGNTRVNLASIKEPSVRWDGEQINLLFINGSESGNINSTKFSNSGGSKTLGGTFSF
jgi:hypothetical protein